MYFNTFSNHYGPTFGALIKINGTNGAKRSDGTSYTNEEASDLESSSENQVKKMVLPSAYSSEQDTVQIKYYRDPEKNKQCMGCHPR